MVHGLKGVCLRDTECEPPVDSCPGACATVSVTADPCGICESTSGDTSITMCDGYPLIFEMDDAGIKPRLLSWLLASSDLRPRTLGTGVEKSSLPVAVSNTREVLSSLVVVVTKRPSGLKASASTLPPAASRS